MTHGEYDYPVRQETYEGPNINSKHFVWGCSLAILMIVLLVAWMIVRY